MHSLSVGYAVLGSLALIIAVLSARIRQWPVSEPLLALAAGVLVGPHVLGLIEISDHSRNVLLMESTRVLLAIALMAIALRYPIRELRAIVRPLVILILVVLPTMAAVVAGLSWWLVGLAPALALLLGTCLSPTDPVLASSVVTGKPAQKDLPSRTRQLLSMESGLNDGLAYAFVVVAVAAVLSHSLGHSIMEGLYGVVAGAIVGLLVGFLAAKAIRTAGGHRDIDSGSLLVFTLVLAIASLGVARVIHADGILAALIAGLTYNWFSNPHDREEEKSLDEALNRYLILPVFLMLGIEIPWAEWAELGWSGVAFVVLVLLLRRLPLMLVLGKPLGLRLREAAFLGWFGPMGVSAVFYLSHAHHEGVTNPKLWALGSAVVVGSVIAHGMTSSPFRKLYASKDN